MKKKTLRPKARPSKNSFKEQKAIKDRMKKGKMPMVLDYNTSRAYSKKK